jgi:colanic acid/amylovoran biosynthesis protein
MVKKLNIILGNAPINNGNRGCVALSYTSIYLIDKVLSEAGIQYNLYTSDSGQVKAGNYVLNVAGKDVPYMAIRHIIGFGAKGKVKTIIKRLINYKNISNTIKVYKSSDYILDIGQGDSFADIYGKERFDSINLIHREAMKLHKPYCLLPQTVGPFKDDAIRAEAVKAISNADIVMTRDKQSFDYTNHIAPLQKNLKEYIDVAFFLPFKRMSFDKEFVHVGLNISALLWHGGYTRDNQFGLKVDYQKCIRSIIDYFLAIPNVIVHLIPHVVIGERDIENDYEVSFDLQKEYHQQRLVLAPFFLSPVDAKDYISGMDFFMGARMHSTIAAFSSGVPVVPMAYSRKFNGLFIDTLNYNHLVDLKTDAEVDIMAKIKDAFANRSQLKEEIDIQNNTVVAERKQMLVDDLKKFFGI